MTDPDNVQVSWTVKELLERLEGKVDRVISNHDSRIEALERQERPPANGEFRLAQVEARVGTHADSIRTLTENATSDSAVRRFKDRAWARIVAVAGIVGAVGGIVGLIVGQAF